MPEKDSFLQHLIEMSKDDYTAQPSQKKHIEGDGAQPEGVPVPNINYKGFYEKLAKKAGPKQKGLVKEKAAAAQPMSDVEFFCLFLHDMLDAAPTHIFHDLLALPEYKAKAAELYQGPAAAKALRKDLVEFLTDLPKAAQIIKEEDLPFPNANPIVNKKFPEIIA